MSSIWAGRPSLLVTVGLLSLLFRNMFKARPAAAVVVVTSVVAVVAAVVTVGSVDAVVGAVVPAVVVPAVVAVVVMSVVVVAVVHW